jgi:hypothetical protein
MKPAAVIKRSNRERQCLIQESLPEIMRIRESGRGEWDDWRTGYPPTFITADSLPFVKVKGRPTIGSLKASKPPI